MSEPIYSKRYPREGEGGRAKGKAEFEAPGSEKPDFARGQARRDMILRKVIEATSRSQCDVDIFEGNGTMLVKIYLDFRRSISGLAGMLRIAGTFSINDANNGPDSVLTVLYDLDAK
ncbi:MAG: hypothetical protein NC319_08080 [Butyricicoccus sp.]|nr:hypothetical protein [Butyricicoccus sp.]MCM1237722.1 hypothetical protein [Ruminococcus flavefaciens]